MRLCSPILYWQSEQTAKRNEAILIVSGCWTATASKPSRCLSLPFFLSQLEAYAREIGATAIGYAKITPDHIFKGFVVPYQNAVVVISEMRKELFNTAPSTESMVEVAKAYADTTQIANKLSSHLRRHGFGAFSGVSIGGSVDQTRLAERAGLGKIGYHGSLISPENGPVVRLNFVYTNIQNLPYPSESVKRAPEVVQRKRSAKARN